jgi:hypothetical protein
MNKQLALLSSILCAAATGHAGFVLVNFGDNNVAGNWNNYDLNGAGNTTTGGTLNETGIADLIDSLGASSGIAFSIADSGVPGLDIFTSAATVGDYASSGLPSWFSTSDAAMRESYVWGDRMDVTYTFSGFQTTDVVAFSFLIDATSNTGDRRIAVGGTSGYTLAESQTRIADASLIFDDGTTVTGATSYSIILDRQTADDSFSGAIPAMQITVVPEPSTYALLAGLLTLGLVMVRRRLKG